MSCAHEYVYNVDTRNAHCEHCPDILVLDDAERKQVEDFFKRVDEQNYKRAKAII